MCLFLLCNMQVSQFNMHIYHLVHPHLRGVLEGNAESYWFLWDSPL